MDDTAWQTLREELAADVRRVADRLRGLSEARLAAGSAAVGRSAAQALADAAAALEAVAAGTAAVRRRLPELSPFAVGDQVAVAGNDLLAAMAEVASDQPVAMVEAASDQPVAEVEAAADQPVAESTAGELVARTAADLAAARRQL